MIFASKLEFLTVKGKFLPFPQVQDLGEKTIDGTNTLAYLSGVKLTEKKFYKTET